MWKRFGISCFGEAEDDNWPSFLKVSGLPNPLVFLNTSFTITMERMGSLPVYKLDPNPTYPANFSEAKILWNGIEWQMDVLECEDLDECLLTHRTTNVNSEYCLPWGKWTLITKEGVPTQFTVKPVY